MRLTVIVPIWGGRDPRYFRRLFRHFDNMPYKLQPVWNEGGEDYYNKVAEALQKVSTPYAMRADDDDFLAMSGIERCLDFLDANPDYVAASGRIAGFSVSGPQKPLYGRLNRRYLYYRATELDQPVATRIEMGGLQLWLYYAVHRTTTLRQITQDIADINFSDLLLYEAFHTMRTLTLGKVHLDKKSISYFRQYGTSTSGPTNKDWPQMLLRSTFTQDIAGMIECLGHEDIVLGALDAKFTQFIRANYSMKQQIKRRIEARFPRLVKCWQTRRDPLAFLEWWDLRRMLREDGATKADIEIADAELAMVKSAIKP